MCNAKKMIRSETGKTFISSNHLLDELPLMKIKTKAGISKLLKELESWGLIETEISKTGRKYYDYTIKFEDSLRRDLVEAVNSGKQAVNHSKRQTAEPVYHSKRDCLLQNMDHYTTNHSTIKDDHSTKDPKEGAPKNGAPVEPEIEEDAMQEDLFGEPEKPKLPDDPKNVTEIHNYFLLMARDKNEGYRADFKKERSQIKDFLKRIDWGNEPDIVHCIKVKMDIYFKIESNVKFGWNLGIFLTQFNSWTLQNEQYQSRKSNGFTRNPVIPKGNSAGVYVDSNAGKFGWTQEDYDAVERKTIKG
jgi:hypothetical protein